MIMKKLYILIFLAITTVICSCDNEEDGAWDPIKLSKSEVTFDENGGSVTIESKNYNNWWINVINVVGTDIYYLADPGDNYLNVNLTASGEGISAKIAGSKNNTVIITVDPSSGKNEWSVVMQAGNAFTSIKVRQNK